MDKEREYLKELFLDKEFMKGMTEMKRTFFSGVNLKNAQLSTALRQSGNSIYVQNKNHDARMHDQIFKLYCQSISMAPNNSEELALAYGNRSAFLFHMKKYEACMLDVARALSIPVSEKLKKKLLARSAQCEIALASLKTISVTTKLSGDRIKKDQMDGENEEQDDIMDILKSVDVRYNEKHGRHLVANRDFRPGEILFCEKAYTFMSDAKRPHTYCSHCSAFCWSAIPCEYCILSMFCSEQCRKEALEKFHGVECPIIGLLIVFKYEFFVTVINALRSIILALKKAGSIEKLRNEIRLVDESKDMRWRGIKHKGKLLENKFSMLYSASNLKLRNSFIEENRTGIMLVLLSLIKYLPILEEKFEQIDIENLKNDPNTMFLGSLLIKILKIKVLDIRLKTSRNECQYSKNAVACLEDQCCLETASCFAPMTSFVNHSCYPNLSFILTEDHRIILYAVHPIKKNSEIFISYGAPFDFQYQVKRQKHLDKFELICDCLACKHNWLPYSNLPERDKISMMSKLKPRELEIEKNYNLLLRREPAVQLDGAIQALADCITKNFSGKQKTVFIVNGIDKFFNVLFLQEVQFCGTSVGEVLKVER